MGLEQLELLSSQQHPEVTHLIIPDILKDEHRPFLQTALTRNPQITAICIKINWVGSNLIIFGNFLPTSNIKVLDLIIFRGLTIQSARAFAAALSHYNNLEELHITGGFNAPQDNIQLNCISKVIKGLPPNIKSLSIININLNVTPDNYYWALALAGKKIKTLMLLNTGITDTSAKDIFPPLRVSLRTLEVLDVSDNKFQQETCTSLAHLINLNRQLRYFKCGYNAIGDVGAVHIATAITNHPSLQEVGLSHCSMDSVGIQGVLIAVRNTAVKELDISGNPFTAADADVLIKTLKVNTKLIDVSYNKENVPPEKNEIIATLLDNNSKKRPYNLSILALLNAPPPKKTMTEAPGSSS